MAQQRLREAADEMCSTVKDAAQIFRGFGPCIQVAAAANPWPSAASHLLVPQNTALNKDDNWPRTLTGTYSEDQAPGVFEDSSNIDLTIFNGEEGAGQASSHFCICLRAHSKKSKMAYCKVKTNHKPSLCRTFLVGKRGLLKKV